MKRVLCVWLPEFPIQRLFVERPELNGTACVLYAESGNRIQVVMASSEALRSGVRAGMPLAEAQALLESATFIAHETDSDLRELQRLAHRCHHYSPSVGLDGLDDQLSPTTHCLLLDISGCAHLFGNELGLTRRLIADLASHGYFAFAAVANTIGSAWAVARFGYHAGSDGGLKSLPVDALRIPAPVVAQLREFDLHTVGQLLALPRESLPSRFGTVLTERLDQMLGLRDELLVPVSTPEPIRAEWITDEPICHPDAVRYVCEDLLAEILSKVKARGEGLLRLVLTVSSEAGESQSFDVRLTRPTDSEKHVRSLLHLKLETQPVPEWLVAIRMEAAQSASLSTRPRSLFEEDVPDASAVRHLCDRLSARLGQGAVVRAELLPEMIPERAVGYRPLEGDVSDTRAVSGSDRIIVIASARPVELLCDPMPLTSCVSEAPPTMVEWNRRRYRLVRFTKPERIVAGWWRDTGTIRRDYYQAETQSGARLWLYRDQSDQWFLHGVFE